MIFINLLKKVIRWHRKKTVKKYAICGSGLIDRGIILRVDCPSKRKLLKIGNNCIIAGKFIFESKQGSICIGDHTYIGGGNFISHNSITIGNNVTIAWGGTVYDHDSHSLDYLERRKDIDSERTDIRNGRNFIENKNWSSVHSKPIMIEDDAWIGMNVTILKGVTIGRGAIIGAGSVVASDIPEWTIAVGNPAKVVKTNDYKPS